ncbi:hypothetical protein Hanom_Chr05g00405571 [Helianthus anomalus]
MSSDFPFFSPLVSCPATGAGLRRLCRPVLAPTRHSHHTTTLLLHLKSTTKPPCFHAIKRPATMVVAAYGCNDGEIGR